MAVFFWYLVKSEFSSAGYGTRVPWTSHLLKGTRKLRLCITGQHNCLNFVKLSIFYYDQKIYSMIHRAGLKRDIVAKILKKKFKNEGLCFLTSDTLP